MIKHRNYDDKGVPYRTLVNFNFKNGDTIVLAIQYGDLGKKTFVFNGKDRYNNKKGGIHWWLKIDF